MSRGSTARGRLAASRANRRLLIFVAASVALHFLLTATALVAPGLLGLPERKPLKQDAPLPSFEFVVVQEKGFGKPTAPEAADKPAPEGASIQTGTAAQTGARGGQAAGTEAAARPIGRGRTPASSRAPV